MPDAHTEQDDFHAFLISFGDDGDLNLGADIPLTSSATGSDDTRFAPSDVLPPLSQSMRRLTISMAPELPTARNPLADQSDYSRSEQRQTQPHFHAQTTAAAAAVPASNPASPADPEIAALQGAILLIRNAQQQCITGNAITHPVRQQIMNAMESLSLDTQRTAFVQLRQKQLEYPPQIGKEVSALINEMVDRFEARQRGALGAVVQMAQPTPPAISFSEPEFFKSFLKHVPTDAMQQAVFAARIQHAELQSPAQLVAFLPHAVEAVGNMRSRENRMIAIRSILAKFEGALRPSIIDRLPACCHAFKHLTEMQDRIEVTDKVHEIAKDLPPDLRLKVFDGLLDAVKSRGSAG